MRVFSFHLMPYPGLPDDYDGPAWVTVPNQIFDPQVGHEIYNRYLDELIYADELGFDGVCINEHHQNAYGLMPSPNLMGSILARQTKRARICIVGNALPLYDPPTRVAEEFAMIDNISGGRLIAGFVVGGGPEYYSFSINPAHARERFYEAHDIVIKAWTEPGPTEYIGKHYKLRFMNTWPRPIQQPHPEVWIPGAGSLETMEFVARTGTPTWASRTSTSACSTASSACSGRPANARATRTTRGRPDGSSPSMWPRRTSRLGPSTSPTSGTGPGKLLPGIEISPPGYTSLRSLENILKGRHQFALSLESWDEVVDGEYAIVGSPDTVYEKLVENIERLGTGQPARAVPARDPAGRPHPAQPRALRRRGHASPQGALPRGEPILQQLSQDAGLNVETLYADTHVGKIQYRRSGSGPGSSTSTRPTARARGCLSSICSPSAIDVVAPMFPGFGDSEGLEQIDDMEDATFHLLDLFERLDVDRPILVGSSLGGWMAAEVATRYPDRVERLVLVNPAGLYLRVRRSRTSSAARSRRWCPTSTTTSSTRWPSSCSSSPRWPPIATPSCPSRW